MTVNKRKKNSRYRGSHTHGCGSKKKRRGAGNRGGRGHAGSGKRGDAKKPSYWKLPVGKHGFTPHNGAEERIITLEYIQKSISRLIHEGKALKKDSMIEFDAKKLGYTKLLSKGVVEIPLHIIIPRATKNAEDKVVKAGGSLKKEEQ